MINPYFRRLTLLTGSEAAVALEKSRVIVFGLGGVGSWCAEALVRSGVGDISLVDADRVCASNVNRQAQASSETIGRYKAEALEERLLQINPSCRIKAFPLAFSKDTAGLFGIPGANFVIDAIDTLPFKLDLIEASVASGSVSGSASGRRFFSSMGMAQKLDPTLLRTADIWETSGCPLARLVRQGLKKRNFNGHFTVVYSPERLTLRETPLEKREMGSSVTVTAAAGMALASLVLRAVIGDCNRE